MTPSELLVRSAATNQKPEPPAVKPATVPGLLNRNVLLLWIAQFISDVGSISFFVAMLFWLKAEMQSAAWMGGMAMLAKLPGVFAGPLGGIAADRYSRRKIMVVCDLIDGSLILSLGLLLWFAQGPTATVLIGFGLVCVCNEFTNAFFLPAQTALLPDLVPARRLAAANTVGQILLQVSNLFGTMLGSALLVVVGAASFFIFNGMCYFLSMICLFLMILPRRRLVETVKTSPVKRRLRGELQEAFRFLQADKGLLIYQWGGLGFMLVMGVTLIMLPFFVEDVLGQRAEWYGFLMAASGLGALVGMVAAGWPACDGRRRLAVLSFLIAASSLGLGAFGFITHPLLAAAFMFIGGASGGFLIIHSETLLQLSVPSGLRGRVLSLISMARMIVFAVGMGVGGLLGQGLGHNVALVYFLCGIGLFIVGLAVLGRRPVRQFLSATIAELESRQS